MTKQTRVFVLGKPFQSSLMFEGKARSVPKSGAPEGASLGKTLALLANIRLEWKGLSVTNILTCLTRL